MKAEWGMPKVIYKMEVEVPKSLSHPTEPDVLDQRKRWDKARLTQKPTRVNILLLYGSLVSIIAVSL